MKMNITQRMRRGGGNCSKQQKRVVVKHPSSCAYLHYYMCFGCLCIYALGALDTPSNGNAPNPGRSAWSTTSFFAFAFSPASVVSIHPSSSFQQKQSQYRIEGTSSLLNKIYSPLSYSLLHGSTNTNKRNIDKQRNRAWSNTKLFMALPPSPPPVPVPPSLYSTIQNFLSAFSTSNIQSATTSTLAAQQTLEHITSIVLQTPPIAYFLALVSAGFGIPVSEDALCVFAGTVLPNMTNAKDQVKLLMALYGGVVVSDLITFTLGRVISYGLMKPLQKRLNLSTEKDVFCEINYDDDGNVITNPPDCVQPTPALRKRDRILTILENTSGIYAGFLIRFSVGMRGPMMLLTGFSNKVTPLEFALGASVGGIFSLMAQLLLGYMMKGNPVAVLGLIASISTFVMMIPVCLAFGSWMAILKRRVESWKEGRRESRID